jgi:hypothetical protein
VVTDEYILPGLVGIGDIGWIHYFDRLSSDRAFTVSLVDVSGLRVGAIVHQLGCCDFEGDETSLARYDVCGRMAGPVRLLASTRRVSVSPELGTCGGSPSVPIKGSIKTVFITK